MIGAVDVVASTNRLAVLGDFEACREYQRLRGLISAMTTTHYGGVDGDRGDGVIARFDSVANATAAAMCMAVTAPEVSSPLAGEPLRVRAGIHWGSMLVDDRGHAFRRRRSWRRRVGRAWTGWAPRCSRACRSPRSCGRWPSWRRRAASTANRRVQAETAREMR